MRPEANDTLRRAAATLVVEHLAKAGLTPNPAGPERGVDQIVSAAAWTEHDGFRIARNLEDCFGWQCDLAVAEELDTFGTILDDLVLAAQRQWAAATPEPAPLRDGTEVHWRGADYTIAGVDSYRPRSYRLASPSLGKDAFYVVPFEDIPGEAEATALQDA